MKKIKTTDGYEVYRIKKERNYLFLADQVHYEAEINRLINNLDGLTFDSLIFLFGLDTGAYLKKLKERLCAKNRVIIFEPNSSIIKRFPTDLGDNIFLVPCKKNMIKQIFHDTILFRNFDNIYFFAFGNYKTIYQKEYELLIENLDWSILNAASQVDLARRFKKVFIQNMTANMNVINQSTPIHRYLFSNVDVPAIVVSGGSSLDANIKDMVKYKDQLKNTFIITGSRTVDALVRNGIMPDMIVSVDPIDANYEMMKDHLNLNVPLAFYEYSNRYLLKDYQGEKIFISLLFSHTIKGMEHLKGVYCGGSVAHACIDIANMLGCSPILLVGQDLAFTNQKHHADSATFPYDNGVKYHAQIAVKDIYGKQTTTSVTLEHFRKNLEFYINRYKDVPRVKFINCSYGANIKGAPHKELSDLLKKLPGKGKKQSCTPSHELNLPANETIKGLLHFLDEFSLKSRQCMELCVIIRREQHQKSLVDVEEDDLDLQRILYILQTVNIFENHPYSRLLGGYFHEFLFDMKDKNGAMPAKEYENLTSDLQYQAEFFNKYFKQLEALLTEVKETVLLTVSEFYPTHIV